MGSLKTLTRIAIFFSLHLELLFSSLGLVVGSITAMFIIPLFPTTAKHLEFVYEEQIWSVVPVVTPSSNLHLLFSSWKLSTSPPLPHSH
ncbi:hypothetical protein BDY19DRAFT_976482, partial [Irpex rosettiformis]